MKTSGIYLRRQFQPLTVGAKLVCASPDSPLTQFFDAGSNAYIPDRSTEGNALRIAPVITASADDGSWNGLLGNAYMGNPTFYMDGTKITIDSTNYALEADSKYRWVLAIKKNFPIGERHTIWMEAEMNDYRTGQNIPVKTDMITLYTGAFAADGYTLEFGGSKNVLYDPLLDTRLAAEYLTAKGTSTTDPDDGSGYVYKQSVKLKKGKTDVSTYTIKVYSTTGSTTQELTAGKGLLAAASKNEVTLDLRLADGEAITVSALVGGKEVARAGMCTVTRLRNAYDVQMQNEEDIYPTAVTHRDRAFVSYKAQVLEAAENVIDMCWKTDTTYATETVVGYGASVNYPLQKTKVGNTYRDGWIEQYIEHEHKPPYALATDESGNSLTDESGNYLIIN